MGECSNKGCGRHPKINNEWVSGNSEETENHGGFYSTVFQARGIGKDFPTDTIRGRSDLLGLFGNAERMGKFLWNGANQGGLKVAPWDNWFWRFRFLVGEPLVFGAAGIQLVQASP